MASSWWVEGKSRFILYFLAFCTVEMESSLWWSNPQLRAKPFLHIIAYWLSHNYYHIAVTRPKGKVGWARYWAKVKSAHLLWSVTTNPTTSSTTAQLLSVVLMHGNEPPPPHLFFFFCKHPVGAYGSVLGTWSVGKMCMHAIGAAKYIYEFQFVNAASSFSQTSV